MGLTKGGFWGDLVLAELRVDALLEKSLGCDQPGRLLFKSLVPGPQ